MHKNGYWIPAPAEKYYWLYPSGSGFHIVERARSSESRDGHYLSLAIQGTLFATEADATLRVDKLNEEFKKALKPLPWKPTFSSVGWVVFGDASVVSRALDPIDDYTKIYNCFQTKQEAEEAAEELKQWFLDRAQKKAEQAANNEEVPF